MLTSAALLRDQPPSDRFGRLRLRAAGSARHQLDRHTSLGVATSSHASDGFSAKPLIYPRSMALVVTGRNLGRRSGGALRLWTRVDHRRARRDRRDGPRRASSQCGGTVRSLAGDWSRWETSLPHPQIPNRSSTQRRRASSAPGIIQRQPSAPRSRHSAQRQRGCRRRIISPGATIVVEVYATMLVERGRITPPKDATAD